MFRSSHRRRASAAPNALPSRPQPPRCRPAKALRRMGEREGEVPALPHDERRCAFVALIGAPNAGKSTLTNVLVGSKVSIVSRKVQTTRALMRGVAMVGDAQLVLMDTP